jgi:endoglucanase
MELCVFCQGPVDKAAGICLRCGRAAPENQEDQPPPFSLNHATPASQCPRCGEATSVENQRFCSRCGLALASMLPQHDGHLVAQFAGAAESAAEAQAGRASPLQVALDPAGVWWESPTAPEIKTSASSAVSSGFRRRRLWFSVLLLVAVGIGSVSAAVILHAPARVPAQSSTGAGAPEASATSVPPSPTTPASPQPVGTGYWHTDGTQLVDAANQPVRIAGINWFGFESSTFVVHGLGQRDYHDLLQQVKRLGYNTIRLPFSDQLFFDTSVPNGISFANGMNQDLQGLSGLQIMDQIVDYAGQLGLKIILDHHGVDAGVQTALWSAPDCSVSCFEADWQQLATHYLGNTTVIGADLDNEPHGAACWGCGDPAVDWQMEAEKLGNELLAINPHWLIFVEGVECYKGDCYWWGGNLEGVADTPVQLNVPHQVVYSPHDYPHDVYDLHYFHDSSYPNNLPGIWEAHWGFIARQHIAPLMLGEFGTLLADTADQQWLSTLVNYLGTGVMGISWTYWALNPDSGDTGGILQNDWVTVNQQKQDYLTPLEFPLPGGTAGNG